MMPFDSFAGVPGWNAADREQLGQTAQPAEAWAGGVTAQSPSDRMTAAWRV